MQRAHPSLRRRALLAAATLAVAVPSWASSPPPVGAATFQPKVVVVVGPVGGLTADYVAWGREAAAEVRRYTPNVIEIYSPRATWERVRPALQGASVVVYLGHGNGWPSRYRTALVPEGHDGIGLNPVSNGDNTTTRYWGETYLARDVRLAPNAVVLLHRLCYASGNNEPGLPEGGAAVAEQRADNFAAGWLAAGARVVVAEGHYSPLHYIRSLFTRSAALDQVFADGPGAQGHAYTVRSVRTPGALVELDPENPGAGFYRSISGWPATTTDQVVRTPVDSTAAAPAALAVPGIAAVTADPAGLYADAALTPTDTGGPPATLAAGTLVRVDAAAAPLADGTAVFAVATLDGTASGYARGPDLAARDSAPPIAWLVRTGTGALSPNGDGRGDTLAIAARLSEPATWQLTIRDAAGAPVASFAGAGQDVAATWTGLDAARVPLPEGDYAYDLVATDASGNAAIVAAGRVAIDLTPPVGGPGPGLPAEGPAGLGDMLAVVRPNGDGVGDTIAFPYAMSEDGYVDLEVANAAGTVVRTRTIAVAAGGGTITWEGGNYLGAPVAPGVYTAAVRTRDLAGNSSPAVATAVLVSMSPAGLTVVPARFFPQDGDALASRATITYTLDRPATVTLDVVDRAGAVVYSRYASLALDPGTYGFAWDGRDQAGTLVPRGWYRARATATDASGAVTTWTARVLADAFAIGTSASASAPAARGGPLTVTAVTSEPLAGAPTLRIVQPGVVPWTVTMTKVSATTWRARVTLRTGGTDGTLALVVGAKDAGGGRNSARLDIPIR